MEKLTKEKAQEIMALEGEVRGVVFKTDMEFVLREKGEEGLKKVESKTREIGFPIEYQEIKLMDFYPLGLRVISLLAIKETFDFGKEKIEEMGFFATKTSFLIKLFVKYFFSLERVFFKEAPNMWKKHYTLGKLIPAELNQEEKYAILRVENFVLRPFYCSYLAGYFCGILRMLIKTNEISWQETKCPFSGENFHEFIIKWK